VLNRAEAEPAAVSTPSSRRSVSVVVCAYTERRFDLLRQAVESLLRQSLPPTEVILVCDHSRALAERARATFGDSVGVVESAEPKGLSGARNAGINHASGEIVAFLDDDAAAAPDWLARLTEPYDDPRVIGTGGTVTPSWGAPRPPWLPEEFMWVVGCSYRGLPEGRRPIRNPIGAGMSFRRAPLLRVGGFRGDLGRLDAVPAGCEETEAAIKVRETASDAVILHVPDAVVAHHVPAERATWRYFASRCAAEGRSKALVVQHVGAVAGLASERAYALRTLTRGIRVEGARAVRGDAGGLARAAAIVTGLAVTAAAYGNTRLRMRLRRGRARS
jgi:GT2 family glycosyltransferase